jgi:predicted transcriptional regulator
MRFRLAANQQLNEDICYAQTQSIAGTAQQEQSQAQPTLSSSSMPILQTIRKPPHLELLPHRLSKPPYSLFHLI